MYSKVNLSEEARGQIVKSYLAGQSMNSLAKFYKISSWSIQNLLEKESIGIRGHNANYVGKEAEIAADYVSGISLARLMKKYKIDFLTVNAILKDANQKKRSLSESQRTYTVNDNFLDNIDTEEKAYYLGFMFADGYNQENEGKVRLGLQARDIGLLEKFRDLLDSNHPIGTGGKKGGNYVSLEISSTRLSKRLAELGCHQAKTFSLVFPEWLTDNLIPHFIRGYIDGDGCIYHKGKHVKVDAIGTVSFISKLSLILSERCNVKMICRELPNQPKILVASVRGRFQAKRVLEYLYKDSTIFLERKKASADLLINSPEILWKKLNLDQVYEIREKLVNCESPQKLATEYGVHFSTIYRIKNHDSWCHNSQLSA